MGSNDSTAGPRRRTAASALPASRRRGWLVGLAAVLIACATALSSYLVWEYCGTNWQSHRIQRSVVGSLERGWKNGHNSTRPGNSRSLVDAIVRIPRFGANYRVPLFEGTSEADLSAGFGHFAATARPGARGNFVIIAHRVTHGEPLRDMPELRPGDVVRIDTRTTEYTYVLDTSGDGLVVPDSDTSVLLPRPPAFDDTRPTVRSDRLITLVTCAELFHTDNRMVAFGHLLRVRSRS